MNPENSSQWQLLQNALQQNRLSHAYLLTGAADSKKTDFAKRFATFLLCEKKNQCGECHSCRWIQAGTHPDFTLIQPEEKNHSIKVDQIRALNEKSTRTSQQGGYQIVIISPADAMPIQAANALLKTLEEPAGKMIFFLIDEERHHLPATIVSRCQKIIFHSEQNNTLKNNTVLRDQLLHQLEMLIARYGNPSHIANGFAKESLENILNVLMMLSSDLLCAKQNATAEHFMNKSIYQRIMSLAKRIDGARLQKWIDLLLEKKSFIVKGINLNHQLCLEDIFIAWEKISI